MSTVGEECLQTAAAATNTLECAVCLQICNHPTQLPCGHIFCFLCVKGVAIQNKRCAMCRQEIPSDYLDNPILLQDVSTGSDTSQEGPDDGFQWYYEGRNGWWKYDERSNTELETQWSAGATECSLLLAGALYRVDFRAMLQSRRNDTTRRRRVRRDTPQMPAKGVAGIKIFSKPVIEEIKGPELQNENEVNETGTAEQDSQTEEVILIEELDGNSSAEDLSQRLATTITSALRSISLQESSDPPSENVSLEQSEQHAEDFNEES